MTKVAMTPRRVSVGWRGLRRRETIMVSLPPRPAPYEVLAGARVHVMRAVVRRRAQDGAPAAGRIALPDSAHLLD